jgi:hypothetical protein
MKNLERLFETGCVSLFALAISILGIGSFVGYHGNFSDIIVGVIFSLVAIALWIVAYIITVDYFKSLKSTSK